MGAAAIIQRIPLDEVDGIKSQPTFNFIVGGCWKRQKSIAVIFSIFETR
jgi:hypothetical protein